MNFPRNFLYQLPIAFCLLLLATAVMVRATAPAYEPNFLSASLQVAEAIRELAAE